MGVTAADWTKWGRNGPSGGRNGPSAGHNGPSALATYLIYFSMHKQLGTVIVSLKLNQIRMSRCR